jgi:hypothetical protein
MANTPIASDAVDENLQDFQARFSNKTDSRYKVAQYSYPSGIGVRDDMQHYVAFYINVRGKTKFKTGNLGTSTILDDVKVASGQNRLDPNKTAEQITAATTATGFLATGAASTLSDFAKGEVSLQTLGNAVSRGAVGAGAGALAGKIVTETKLIEPDTLKRLSDVIVLHIQDRPSTNYSVNYQDKELGTIGGVLAGGASSADLMASAGTFAKDTGAAAIAGIVAAVSGALGGPGGQLLELGSKQKTNSFREQFFESVDYRTFNFKHTFMPKSRVEADNVRRIIDLFKFHMHPELSKGGLFYVYPSEFEIKYYYRNEENKYFDKISSCVLEDMGVEYGGDIFSTFNDGKPVEVNLTLKFKELELLTKERIKEGY